MSYLNSAKENHTFAQTKLPLKWCVNCTSINKSEIIMRTFFSRVPLWLCFPSLNAFQARSSRDTGKSPSSLGLADFDLLRVIGRGSYAKVLLVQLKKTERIYAMKVVKKELVNDDEVSKFDWWWRVCLIYHESIVGCLYRDSDTDLLGSDLKA